MPVVSITGLLIAAILLIKPVLPAPPPSTLVALGPNLALEGGAIASAAGPVGNPQPAAVTYASSVMNDGAVLASASPVSGLSLSQDGSVIYKVSKGDTVSSLAVKFNISRNTIWWANNLSRGAPLVVGQELIILPVSGVLYNVQNGDTISSIAATFNVSPSNIITLMGNPSIQVGDIIVIEGGKPLKNKTGQGLLNLGGYLRPPMYSITNVGSLDNNNGVEVSAVCGDSIYASAEGLVTKVGDPGQWNNGLGGFVEVSHPMAGVQTVYAHTASNEVSVGDYVAGGKEIAKAGNTGQTGGTLGCNLYFEVVGAENPLAK